MNELKSLSCGLYVALWFCIGCSNGDLPEPLCENSDLVINAVGVNPLDCSSNGSIQITATGGNAPYLFALDAGDFTGNSSFADVVAGSHIAWIKDKNGCVVQQDVVLTNPSSSLVIDDVDVVVSGCKTDQGQIIISASGGADLTYSTDNAGYGNTTGTFLNLSPGIYSVYVKDSEGCITSESNVRVTTGVSYLNDIKPILVVNCIKSGCHNGDNGATRNWSVFENVQAKAEGIKTRTGNGTMPADQVDTGGLPQSQRDLIACWVDDGAPNN